MPALCPLYARCVPQSAPPLLAGRVLTGVGVGLVSNLVPNYIAEISPRQLRGSLGAINQLAVTLGILLVCPPTPPPALFLLVLALRPPLLGRRKSGAADRTLQTKLRKPNAGVLAGAGVARADVARPGACGGGAAGRAGAGHAGPAGIAALAMR